MSMIVEHTLEALLEAPDDARFSKLLATYGPIEDRDLDTLATRARERRARVRRNATRLLAIAKPSPDRELLLRRLVHDTLDPAVFVLACDALPDGAVLAHQRAKLITEALASGDAVVAALALGLAWRADLPEVRDRLRADLVDERAAVRDAALAIVAEAGAGPLAPALITLLADPAAPRGPIVQALVRVDDPAIADAVATALATATPGDRVAVTNALAAVPASARAPWVHAFLRAQIAADGPWRWSAFAALAAAPTADDTAALVALARDHLTAELASGVADGELRWREGVGACAQFLTALAGHTFPTLAALRDYATSR